MVEDCAALGQGRRNFEAGCQNDWQSLTLPTLWIVLRDTIDILVRIRKMIFASRCKDVQFNFRTGSLRGICFNKAAILFEHRGWIRAAALSTLPRAADVVIAIGLMLCHGATIVSAPVETIFTKNLESGPSKVVWN